MSEHSPSELSSTPAPSFEKLRTEAQSELLANDSVFSLVSTALRFDEENEELPDFQLDVYYPSVPDDAFAELDNNPNDYVGMGFRIQASAISSTGKLPELGLKFAAYQYIKLGYLKRDGSGAALFDDAGRLHHPAKADDSGSQGFERDSISPERMDAAKAWIRAHNKLLRASRSNPDMHIDDIMRVWTDKHFYSVE